MKKANGSTYTASNGETAATKAGKDAHKNYKPGSNYSTSQSRNRLNNGTIPDAINFKRKIVRELKPNNSRARRLGRNQVNEYAKQLEKQYGGKWKTVVDTYDVDANGNVKYNFNKPK